MDWPKPMTRKLVAIAMIFLILGTGVGAVAMSMLHPEPSTVAIDNAQKQIRVTAKVEERAVRTPTQLQGKFSARETAGILPIGTGKMMVTKVKLQPGDTVASGTLLAEINSRPVFGFSRDIPLFRDLAPGTTGTDVEAFQQYLSRLGYYRVNPSGKFDAMTSTALEAMYRDYGYTTTTPAGFPLSDAAFVPNGEYPVVAVAGIGDELGKDKPLLVLEVSGTSISSHIDMLQASYITIGSHMTASANGKSGDAVVISKSDYKPNGDNKPAGYDIMLSAPTELNGMDPSNTVTLVEIATPQKGLAVPLGAVRTDGTRHYISVVDATQDRQVDVAITSTVQGWAIITSASPLSAGTEVVVAG